MPGTYTSLHYHVIFSTKSREPFIAAAWRARLHEYLGGMIHGLGGTPVCVGGVADHVHLLFGLKATHCLFDFMRDLKKDATNWTKETLQQPHFAWQEGYAARRRLNPCGSTSMTRKSIIGYGHFVRNW